MSPRRFRRSVPDDKIVDQAFEMLKSSEATRHHRRQRLHTQTRQQTTARALRENRHWRDQHIHGEGLGRHGRRLLPVHRRTRQQRPRIEGIDDADLVITLGFDMVEYHPQLWNAGKDKRILHADFLPAEIDEHYHPETELVGDLAHALWMLNERIDEHGLPDYDLTCNSSVRAAMADDFAEHKDDQTEGSIRPQKALWDARQVMGPHDILLSDVGAHKMWIARHYQCHEPNTCLIPNGFCSMGFALPGAIAASIVEPERRILAICGDAGFLMNVQEMETAVRYDSNIVVMVWEDNEYGLIAWKQTHTLAGTPISHSATRTGTDSRKRLGGTAIIFPTPRISPVRLTRHSKKKARVWS